MIAQDFCDHLIEGGFARSRVNSDSTTSGETHIENVEKAQVSGVFSVICKALAEDPDMVSDICEDLASEES